uniref:DNA pilot protein n=1 Tax=Dulem virus 218 TaxID=3145695 RepID=A0AAU8AZ90_9VIRU
MTKYARSILYQVYSKTLFKKSAKNVNNNLNIRIMIPALIGAAGVIGGAVLGNQARQQQTNEEYQKMMYQGNINKDLANHTMKNQKELWDYTNYPNQVKQMKLAGLNPALMYGTAGQGGQSSAGQTGPVGLSDSKGVAMQQQQMAMGLQLAQIASQIKVNDSVAEKNKAEAAKTAGVDTEATKTGIEKMIAETANEKVKKGLIYAGTRLQDALEELNRAKVDEIGWNIRNIEKSIELMGRNIEATDLDNELKSRTMDTEVQRAVASLENIMADTLVKQSQEKVNVQEAKAIAEGVKQKWEQVFIGLKEADQKGYNLELQAEKIANDLFVGKEQVRVGDRNITKDYVLGIGKILLEGVSKFGNVSKIIKGFGR